MSTTPLVDDDDNDDHLSGSINYYQTAINQAIRASGYQVHGTADLDGLNWKLNKIQETWGNYAIAMTSMRAVQPSITALLDLRAKIEALQASWKTIQKQQKAGSLLFADAITKNGRHKILFTLDTVLTSPELKAVLSGLTQHKLQLRLPVASGKIPIEPLVPDLVRLLRRLMSCLKPIPYMTKKVRKNASLFACCGITSALLSIIQVKFSSQAIRNATVIKLP